MDPQCANQWLHFELTNSRLYPIDQTPRTKEPRTQLEVPRSHHRAVVKLAHDVPTAGHLGHEKTLAQILI